jgi:hypothetical protein
MIPIKDKLYKISYTDPTCREADYKGVGRFTGYIEEDSDEPDLTKGIIYRFTGLETAFGFTTEGFFGEEDIIEEVLEKT